MKRTRNLPKERRSIKPLLNAALTCAELRELDRRAAVEYGISVDTLMENAGRAVAAETVKFLERRRRKTPFHVLVLCGSGNNAGDGLVAARILHLAKAQVEVAFLKTVGKLSEAALSNFKKLQSLKIPFNEILDGNLRLDRRWDALIDALLGTGFEGKLEGPLAEAVAAVNRSQIPTVAVDVPSGMNADTGIAEGACVEADLTVALAAMKKGYLNPASRRYTGEVVVCDIGFPKEIFSNKIKPGG